MDKEKTSTRKPADTAQKSKGTASPRRTLPREEAKKLIRKVSAEHKGLFRRLAQ